jgi:hypothetical protein
MGARRLATFAIGALVVAGCGDDDFENLPRPPLNVGLSGVIQDDQVTVSPSSVGAGPITLTVANQTDEAQTVTLEGESFRERVGPVPPNATGEIQRTLEPGQYEVRAGTGRARREEIAPATLEIGAERESSSNDLLLP